MQITTAPRSAESSAEQPYDGGATDIREKRKIDASLTINETTFIALVDGLKPLNQLSFTITRF